MAGRNARHRLRILPCALRRLMVFRHRSDMRWLFRWLRMMLCMMLRLHQTATGQTRFAVWTILCAGNCPGPNLRPRVFWLISTVIITATVTTVCRSIILNGIQSLSRPRAEECSATGSLLICFRHLLPGSCARCCATRHLRSLFRVIR